MGDLLEKWAASRNYPEGPGVRKKNFLSLRPSEGRGLKG
jgi:hypothetical protein